MDYKKNLFHLFYLSLSSMCFSYVRTALLIAAIKIDKTIIILIFNNILFSFLAPIIVTYIKPKLSIIASSLCFLVNFIFFLLEVSPLSKMLDFVSQITMWTAQGTYIIQSATNYSLNRAKDRKSALGYFNSIFYTVNQIGAFLFIQTRPLNGSTLYVVAGLAILSPFFLISEESVAPSSSLSRDNLKKNIIKASSLLKDWRLLLVAPMSIYLGFLQTFNNDYFYSVYVSFHMVQPNIRLIFSSSLVGAFAMGFMADKFLIHLVIGVVSHSILYLYIFFILPSSPFLLQEQSFFDITVVLYSVGYTAWTTFSCILLCMLLTDYPEAAFANIQFWQVFGFILYYLFSLFDIGIVSYIGVSFVLLWISTFSIILLELFFRVFSLEMERAQRMK